MTVFLHKFSCSLEWIHIEIYTFWNVSIFILYMFITYNMYILCVYIWILYILNILYKITVYIL